MRATWTALIVLCVCAPFAFAQCPAQGEINVADASAQDIASRGVDAGLAEKLADRGRSFQGFADLARFAEDHHWKVPKRFVVCRGPSGHTDSLGEEDPPLNVNSAGPGDLTRLRSCGVSPKEITDLENNNRSAVSFHNKQELIVFLKKHAESASADCRSLQIVFERGG